MNCPSGHPITPVVAEGFGVCHDGRYVWARALYDERRLAGLDWHEAPGGWIDGPYAEIASAEKVIRAAITWMRMVS